MKKLLYITSDSWWDTDISILPYLSKEYELEVFCLSFKNSKRNKYPTKELPANVVFHDFKFERSKKDIRMIIQSILYGFRLLFSSFNKTTIWVFDYNPWYSIVLLGLSSSKQTIVSLHNYVLHVDASSWEKKLRKWVLHKYHYFHFHSQMQEDYFKQDYPDKFSFSTKMPVKSFGEPSERFNLFNNNKRTFLFFGRIRDYKRPDLFIEASNRLKGKANFIMAGYTSDTAKYQSMIQEDNPIKCIFRNIENEELPNLFTSVDYLVLPYDDSTQSGPLLIAYNYNLPVITSSLPFFSEMVDNNRTGFIFSKGNLYSLISIIDKAASMSENDYSIMKNNLKNKVCHYIETNSYTKCLKKFINVNKL